MKALDILIYILECGGMIHVDRGFMSNVSKAVEELKEHLSDKDDQIKWLRKELKYNKAELEALQSRSCDGCKYGTAYIGTDRKWFVATDTKQRSNEMKEIEDAVEMINDMHNGRHYLDESVKSVITNLYSLEALQQPKRCDGCKYGKTTINSVICGKNGTYKEADDYCKYFKLKEQQ